MSTCIIILTIIRCRLKLQGELFFVNHFVVWLWLGFVTAAAMVAIIVKCNLGLELDCWCLSVCLSVFHFLYFLGPSPSHEFFFIFPFSHFGCGKDRQKGRQTDCRGIESSLLISLWRHPSWSSSVSFCKLMCTCNLIITCRVEGRGEVSIFTLSLSLGCVFWLWLGFVTAADMVAILVKCNMGLELECWWCLSVCLSFISFTF